MKAFPICLCVFLAATPLLRAEENVRTGEEAAPSRSPATAGLKPIVDYLPAALYTHETLSICLRVENTTDTETKATLDAHWLDKDGASLKKSPHALSCPPKAFTEYTETLRPGDARKLRFDLSSGTASESITVRLLRDNEAWPATRVRNGRLVTENGEVLVPYVKRRMVESDRTWAPVKWALKWGGAGDDTHTPAAQGGAVAWLPGAWRETDSAAHALGPYPADGAPPVLCAAGDILTALPEKAPGRLVVVLPPEDLERGTDPRLYEIALSALLARLANRGVREVVLAGPYRFGVPKAQQERLWKTVDLVARLYSVRTLRMGDRLDEAEWRADPARKGVYGAQPNTAGRAALHNMLKDLLPTASALDDTGK